MPQSLASEPRDLYSATWYPVPKESFDYYAAGGAISEGDVVVVDYVNDPSGSTVVQSSSADSPVAVGIATHDAVAGDRVRVQTGGVYPAAKVDAGVTAGDRLVTSDTAGQLAASASPDAGTVVGVALKNESDGKAPVLLKAG
jgi:predicted RecA/RadA family phage recombinase